MGTAGVSRSWAVKRYDLTLCPRLPFVALGGLLVIVCVPGYAPGAVRLSDRVQVLAVARPVAAGQAITSADLRQVTAAQDAGVALIPPIRCSR